MALDGTGMPPNAALTATDPPKEILSDENLRTLLEKSSEYTLSSKRIETDTLSYQKNRRYVTLKLQDIYNSLVDCYSVLFYSQWTHFKRVSETVGQPNNSIQENAQLLARKYISAWMIDLYISNRQAIKKLSYVAFNEFYTHEHPRNSTEYDVVLAAINSGIRPTHIKGCYEDALFIPKFSDGALNWTPNVNLKINPFSLANWEYDLAHFKVIFNAIKDKRSGWQLAPLSNETVGRPFWLFDWHSPHNCCSWFPRSDNFDNCDVLYAYIIGVACTPKLALQDMDDWQALAFEDSTLESIPLSRYRRKTPRRYFGAYEVDSYATFTDVPFGFTGHSAPEGLELVATVSSVFTAQHTTAKRQRSEETRVIVDTSQPRIISSTAYGDDVTKRTSNLIRLTTWIYYERVINMCITDKRSASVMSLVLDMMSPNIN
nr:capsid protein [Red clover cryptic virus 3]